MERSRSKKNRHCDQDYDSQTLPRTKVTKSRYRHHNTDPYNNTNSVYYRRGGHRAPEASSTLPTSYRILCDVNKIGGVIGKSGSIIKTICQETGAWIKVHELLPGDDERIIEISDDRRRNSDAQEALLMIHERIMELGSEFGFRYNGSLANDEDDNSPTRGGGSSGNRVATRLVVDKMHVGCLMGKGGKIIKQMRLKTKTQIRILSRDRNLPRCVSMSGEIVQVLGDVNAVRRAVEIISSRLKESQLHDRSHFHGRADLPERFCPPDDDFNPHINSRPHQSSIDGFTLGPRSSAGKPTLRNNSYGSHTSGYAFDSRAGPIADNQSQISVEDLVFRILCPVDKLDRVMGQDSGIIGTLQGDVGVNVRVSETIPGSDEQIIIITSEEGPYHELFPAQEALLHIQSQIVDLGPDKDNIVTTRLLVLTSEIGCLEGRDGSLSEIRRLTGADIHILPREEHPACVPEDDELIQIVGEIIAARDALVEVTERLRRELYRESSFPKDLLSPSTSPTASAGSMFGPEADFRSRIPGRKGFHGSDTAAVYQDAQTITTTRPSKEAGVSSGGTLDRNNVDTCDDVPSALSRIPVPLVTKRTLEVVLPEHAIPKLIMRSGNKLAQISELSRASISLIEDRPEQAEKVIQISGTPEQVQKAQNLLQGFILSTQEDDPSS